MAARQPHKGMLKEAPSELHEGLAEWIKKVTGHEVPVGDVALTLRLYPKYLQSPAVKKARDAERARKEAEKAKRDELKRERTRERLAALDAQRQKLLAELGEGEQAESEAEVVDLAKRRKGGKKSNPEADEPVEAEVVEEEADDEFVEPEQADEATVDDDGDDLWGDEDGDDDADEF